MKRIIRCPKCDEAIQFDETQYEPGSVLVFECPDCHKQFKIRMPQPKPSEVPADDAAPRVWGRLVVLENAFHFKQIIPLLEGDNVVGRSVKGTQANAAFKTVDPSVDTTHCIVNVALNRQGEPRFTVRDANSNTGTFVQNRILAPRDRVVLAEGDIINIGATTLILREGEDEAGE